MAIGSTTHSFGLRLSLINGLLVKDRAAPCYHLFSYLKIKKKPPPWWTNNARSSSISWKMKPPPPPLYCLFHWQRSGRRVRASMRISGPQFDPCVPPRTSLLVPWMRPVAPPTSFYLELRGSRSKGSNHWLSLRSTESVSSQPSTYFSESPEGITRKGRETSGP